MYYLKVLWDHNFEDQPSAIYSEIDAEGWEVRKVEIFRDGHSTFADRMGSTGNTILGEKEIDIRKVQSSDGLTFTEISHQSFEQIWKSLKIDR
ncbi:DUF6881 domain-containing protein [Streptomyces sp. NBC_00035]|uniref:DUF6881 domain-containing protein n=1 Tax=Streptomyces sp. NBC_00035 TaxID=2903614 RepID=UPI00386A6CC5